MSDNRSITRRLALTATAGAGALALLTACGNSDGTVTKLAGMADAPVASPTRQPGASFNEADVMFAQMMIEHHRQAVEMADLAETRATNPEVKQLAGKIKEAQQPEIDTMTGWLSEWGVPGTPAPAETPSEGMGGHGMPGMMSPEDMRKLEAAEGAEFDRLFLRMMIDHHEGAIKMARIEQERGTSPEAEELAKIIETTQQAEIEQMRKLLDRM
ncbi:uncharacterized protein (DUF305 family) [Streptosporangium becharense]|uniref:Uncharacterized protein (DUF305 family) n=1 Tax=Streptosporangium becharense TaxID=1816182 RepID=A0A7W9IBM8_9ACTN|nr:DUF305 domain-containing protein [Streptosporangium becharense]MBB2910746.1 uncharacterized protein (DUF305 family) [Streptosporangium becharense]MBB5817441.1 uncharacterized protein (DUF305 family) [Streptosporangium becharense]